MYLRIHNPKVINISFFVSVQNMLKCGGILKSSYINKSNGSNDIFPNKCVYKLYASTPIVVGCGGNPL